MGSDGSDGSAISISSTSLHGQLQLWQWLVCTYSIQYNISLSLQFPQEFIHGDMGRTVPNLGTLCGGCQADILQLDVEALNDNTGSHNCCHKSQIGEFIHVFMRWIHTCAVR